MIGGGLVASGLVAQGQGPEVRSDRLDPAGRARETRLERSEAIKGNKGGQAGEESEERLLPPAPGITASLLQELSAQKNETAGLKQQLARAQALLSRAETRASEAAHERDKLRGEVAAMRAQGCSDQALLAQLAFYEDQVLSLKSQLCDVACEKGVAEERAATLQERTQQLELEICKVFADAEKSCSRWEGVYAEVQSQCRTLEIQLQEEKMTVYRLKGSAAEVGSPPRTGGILSDATAATEETADVAEQVKRGAEEASGLAGPAERDSRSVISDDEDRRVQLQDMKAEITQLREEKQRIYELYREVADRVAAQESKTVSMETSDCAGGDDAQGPAAKTQHRFDRILPVSLTLSPDASSSPCLHQDADSFHSAIDETVAGQPGDVMESDQLGATCLLAHVEEALDAVEQVLVGCLSAARKASAERQLERAELAEQQREHSQRVFEMETEAEELAKHFEGEIDRLMRRVEETTTPIITRAQTPISRTSSGSKAAVMAAAAGARSEGQGRGEGGDLIALDEAVGRSSAGFSPIAMEDGTPLRTPLRACVPLQPLETPQLALHTPQSAQRLVGRMPCLRESPCTEESQQGSALAMTAAARIEELEAERAGLQAALAATQHKLEELETGLRQAVLPDPGVQVENHRHDGPAESKHRHVHCAPLEILSEALHGNTKRCSTSLRTDDDQGLKGSMPMIHGDADPEAGSERRQRDSAEKWKVKRVAELEVALEQATQERDAALRESDQAFKALKEIRGGQFAKRNKKTGPACALALGILHAMLLPLGILLDCQNLDCALFLYLF